MKNYFSYIDKVVSKFNDTLDYKINEYTLINNNSWIIDTLASTDYYLKKKSGKKIKNQKELVILPKGTILRIPTAFQNNAIIQNLLANNVIINVPEYKLKIFNNGLLIKDALVRVGRNESRYLASIDKYTDLRTKSGKGKIHSTEKNPTWINPVDGHKYTETTRDDKQKTVMPITPSITMNINNVVTGQLIHATTNPSTLGKAYSNGCIGTNEYDIWYIYYYSPPGVFVEIKYDLNPLNTDETLDDLIDIYKQSEHKLRKD
jgi:L,D-transpeptidase ErfK/SrfK